MSHAHQRTCLVLTSADVTLVTRPMNTSSAAMKDLALRLIALEATREPSDGSVGAAFRACGTLRGSLVKFVGVSGYHSLLSRALTMAKAESPALDPVRVLPDGSLAGLEGVEPNPDADAGAVVVAQLLGLLVTFIGEPLTLRLVWDAWPDATEVEAETDRIDEGRS